MHRIHVPVGPRMRRRNAPAGFGEPAQVPPQVPRRNAPRSGLTAHALDTLAYRRQLGISLNPVTTSMLDQFRPSGPSPSFGKKKPVMPLLEGAVHGPGN